MATPNRDELHHVAADALVEYITRYESDTFSATSSGITKLQAQKVAARVIRRDFDWIDGVLLSEVLDEVRGRR